MTSGLFPVGRDRGGPAAPPPPRPKEQLLAILLVAPAFLYLAGLLVSNFQGWDAASAVGFVALPLLLMVGLYPLYGPLVEFFGYVLVGVLATLATLLDAFGTGGYDFAAGLLLGTPFLLGAWAWTPSRTSPARLMGLGLGLTEGLILLADLHYLVAQGIPETSLNLFAWYTQTNLVQLCGITGLLGIFPSGCLSYTQFPIRDIVDPVFVLLGGLALLGTLVPVLTPRTALGAVGQAEGFEEFDRSAALRPGAAPTPEMLAALEQRSPPRRAPGFAPPGAGALVVAMTFALLLVGLAVAAPTAVLLPIIGSVFVLLLALLLLSRREPTILRGIHAPTGPRSATSPPTAAPSRPAPPRPVPAPPRAPVLP